MAILPHFSVTATIVFFLPGTGINTKGQSSSLGSPSVGSLWWLVVEMTETTWIFVVFSRAEAMEIRLLWSFYCCLFFVLCLFSASSCCLRKTHALEFRFVLLVLLVSFLKFVSCQMHETLHLVRVMPCKMLWAEWGSLAWPWVMASHWDPPVVAGAILGTLFVFATKLVGSRNL